MSVTGQIADAFPDGSAGPSAAARWARSRQVAGRPASHRRPGPGKIDQHRHRRPAMPAASQLSYSHGASPQELLGETIGDNLRRIAVTYPASEALVDVPTGRRWTYAELDADSDTVGVGLLPLGINKGDRVGIWAPTCAEWVVLQYATAKIGAILVNINPAYRSHELAYVLRQ